MEQKRSFYGIAYWLTRVQLSPVEAPMTWCPAINAYRYQDRFVICVELAGVDRDQIDLLVEPHRIMLRGDRAAPEPSDLEAPPIQVLAWEIDQGRFAREIVLPVKVDPDQVKAEQRNGLLWIYLPVASTP